MRSTAFTFLLGFLVAVLLASCVSTGPKVTME